MRVRFGARARARAGARVSFSVQVTVASPIPDRFMNLG